MAELQARYFNAIPLDLGPHDPAAASLVAVNAAGFDIRIPIRSFRDGRTKVLKPAITGNNIHIDYRFNDYFYIDHLDDINTWSFEGLPGEDEGVTLAIYIKRRAPLKNVIWPSSFLWSGGAPLLSDTPGAIDLLILTSFDNGTEWLPDLARNYGGA